jgi:hypothetical protein
MRASGCQASSPEAVKDTRKRTAQMYVPCSVDVAAEVQTGGARREGALPTLVSVRGPKHSLRFVSVGSLGS